MLARAPAARSALSRRHAHLSAAVSPVASTSQLPPPPAAAPASPTTLDECPQWSEPSYQARYRNPLVHDAPRIRLATRSETPSSDSPRSRRLEMERMWSAGEASPPLPDETPQHSKDNGIPKHALLFVGSGSQYVSMGHVLKDYKSAQRVWDEAEESLNGFEKWRRSLGLESCEGEVGELGRAVEETVGIREKSMQLKEVVMNGPQNELTKSSNAQPAILITSVAFLRTLEGEYATPVSKEASYFAGHSSGELGICHAAGMVSFSDSVRLARLHGLLTSHALALPSISLSADQAAPPNKRGLMSAFVLNPGHSHAEVIEVVDSISTLSGGGTACVEVASFNGTSQVVLSGSQDGILRAADILRDRNIASHAADLPVSAPFHCSFMKPAANGMRVALESLNISNPSAPMISGVDGGEINTRSSLIDNLVAQISRPVRWSSCLSTLRTSGVERLLFFGPGKALANLARRDLKAAEKQRMIDGRAEEVGARKTEVLSVATKEDLVAVAELWQGDAARV